MAKRDLTVVIGGEAGQGLVTVGTLLSKALVRTGFFIVVTQDYQSRIRGGHNSFAVRTSPDPIAAPGESIDLLVAMDKQSIAIHEPELAAGAMIIADEALGVTGERVIPVPYRSLGEKRYENVVALGVLGVMLGLDRDLLEGALDDAFGKKDPAVSEQNRRVLAAAFDWTDRQRIDFPAPPRPSEPGHRLMMSGNDAVALGALSAGVRFCSFYPMTPSTSIALALAAWGQEAGVVVEQAEDEIAAINMAIGASFAGAPAVVPTSGGGFALMVEGVSLSGMTETPVVIVMGQRPGPATGLPTRTEQGELMFVIHAGHGEFPKAVFAPGSVEECFYLTRKAFDIAARFQGPTFVLTDQFIADSYRAVEPFELGNVEEGTEGVSSGAPSRPYRRYEITEDGVSPRLLPGMSGHLVVADSDEHTEDGHITEDLGVRKRMVEKRLRKLDGIRKEVVGPEYSGDKKPELLLVSWGSNRGAVLEATQILRKEGRRVGCLLFSQVWPLVPDQFMGCLTAAQEVVGIEGNATGQFAGLLRRETGFAVTKNVLRYDGLPMTPRYILDRIG